MFKGPLSALQGMDSVTVKAAMVSEILRNVCFIGFSSKGNLGQGHYLLPIGDNVNVF